MGFWPDPYWAVTHFNAYDTQGIYGWEELHFRFQSGIHGEFYLNDRWGIHAHLFYERWTFTDDPETGFRLGNFGNYQSILHYRLHLGELGISLRYFLADRQFPLRPFLEAGLGNTFILGGSVKHEQLPWSSFFPEVQTYTYRLRYEYSSVITNAGIQYRFANRWGAEIVLTGRLPFFTTDMSNLQFGLQAGINHYLPSIP